MALLHSAYVGAGCLLEAADVAVMCWQRDSAALVEPVLLAAVLADVEQVLD